MFSPYSTGFGKSLIFQAFVKAKTLCSANERGEKAAVIVISPLVSIINDQLEEMKSIGISAADLSALSDKDIRESNFQICLC